MGISCLFFFFNDTATTEIYTLSLHDALPILGDRGADRGEHGGPGVGRLVEGQVEAGEALAGVLQVARDEPRDARHHRLGDRKSTRLNSSHANISYAVFCLKKKKKKNCVRDS